ncbi:MAG TPA: T9SS type A sorting domain-containing protein [Chitinophagaceae bacterium]
MKKILLFLAIVAFTSFGNKLKAQCDLELNNLTIAYEGTPYPDPVLGPKCQIVFSASFDIKTNSGFKYLFFHSWLAADYPSPAIFNCTGSTPATDPGTAAQLGTTIDQPGKSFLDIGFVGLNSFLSSVPMNVSTDVTSTLATSYPHDNTVALTNTSNSPGLKVFVTKQVNANGDNILHFEVQDVTIVINQACGATLNVKTDIWGSNSEAKDPKAQCYICGIGQLFNDPTIAGLKTCDFPSRKYSLQVSTVEVASTPITIKVYADMNNNGSIEDNGDGIQDPGEDIQVVPTVNWALSAATPYQVGNPFPVAYEPYSSQLIVADRDLIVLVEGPALVNDVFKVIPQPQGCIGLPAEFKSFTANRSSHTNVSLKWETVQELNVSGFALERKTTGNWEEFAFIPTQAPDGNSQTLLTYIYNDVNTNKGMTQYRIRQVDQDSRFKYSIIRAVRGDGQAGNTVVYPNPTSNGKVTVVFDDASVSRDISLFDMTGRAIKNWKNVTNNNIQIDNLVAGIYSLRIVVPATGELSVEKIVVNKR